MKLMDGELIAGAVGGFAFSGVRPETLGATEYTLVTLAIDKTSSVSKFADDLFRIKATVVEACRKSPRADFLLLRVIEFNDGVEEVHGFTPLSEIDANAYRTPVCRGTTALRDATYSAVSAMNAYAKTLAAQDYLTNGIGIVVTDGDDNDSSMSASDVAGEIQRANQDEVLESLKLILVGVNAKNYEKQLKSFGAEVGISQYVDIEDAEPKTMARLADFVSRSISAQSQALGTGGPSKALRF